MNLREALITQGPSLSLQRAAQSEIARLDAEVSRMRAECAETRAELIRNWDSMQPRKMPCPLTA